MKNLPKISKYLLGTIFFVFGGAGLLNLIPSPPDLPQKLQAFMNGILAAGYFFPFLKLTETICGLFLLIGIAPALMLTILAPITIHIVLVHSFLTPGLENLILPLFMVILHITASIQYWKLYHPLFQRNNNHQ